MSPSEHQVDRYVRQTILSSIGSFGQAKLQKSKVLCVGAGGLGSPVISYLAAAGVGTLGIIDYDRVEITNLHRQIIHKETELGIEKVKSAASFIMNLNSQVQVIEHNQRLNEENALSIISNYDVIIDGSDNFSTRYLVNDACVILEIPLIFGSVLKFDGQVSTFDSSIGPCYRCVFPKPPSPANSMNCAIAGVLGSVCGTVGSLMATEAIKTLIGITPTLVGQLLTYDATTSSFDKITVQKNRNCVLCSKPKEQRRLLGNYQESCGEFSSLTPLELEQFLKTDSDIQLIDVRTEAEYEQGFIPGAINIPSGNFMEVASRFNLKIEDSVILYCKSGVRSRICMEALTQLKFQRIAHLEGGYDNWITVHSH